jgi:hypothetical protein
MDSDEKNDLSAKTPDEKTPVKTKKPYNTPVLTDYGDIREITEHIQAGQTQDHGGGSANMTLP